MKRSASLILVELLIMLTVFAVSAALCLRAFVWSDNKAKECAAKDFALMQTQNAAETLKHCRGDFSQAAQNYGGWWDGTSWDIFYDDSWNVTGEEAVYILRVVPQTDETNCLGKAKLTLVDREDTVLAELSVCWQEVVP